jgi:hypothetical protein
MYYLITEKAVESGAQSGHSGADKADAGIIKKEKETDYENI